MPQASSPATPMSDDDLLGIIRPSLPSDTLVRGRMMDDGMGSDIQEVETPTLPAWGSAGSEGCG